MLLADNLDQLLDILPDFIIEPLKKNERKSQSYAYNTILQVSEKQDFQFTQIKNSQDGSIRLLLRRYK